MPRRYLLYVSQPYSLSILRPLQKVILSRGDDVAWFFDGPGAEYLTAEEKRLTSIREVKAFSPLAVFVPGNWVPDFFPGIKVHVAHGFNAGKRAAEKGHFNIRGFFDLYVTQGPDTTLPFQRLSQQYGFFEVRETGWPKLDPLFCDEENVGLKDRPIVMFASTFTPALSGARSLFSTIKKLSSSGCWRWLVNLHPKMDPAVVEAYKSIQGDYLDFPDTDNVIPLLKQADVMVCDTSSILTEFMLQYKPVVTLNNRTPGSQLINITDPADLEGAITTALSRPMELMRKIEEFCEQVHPYRDGQSSLRVLNETDRLIDSSLDHLKSKPLNLWRKYQIRKRLGYYRIR